jgi:hypothetical protein
MIDGEQQEVGRAARACEDEGAGSILPLSFSFLIHCVLRQRMAQKNSPTFFFFSTFMLTTSWNTLCNEPRMEIALGNREENNLLKEHKEYNGSILLLLENAPGKIRLIFAERDRKSLLKPVTPFSCPRFINTPLLLKEKGLRRVAARILFCLWLRRHSTALIWLASSWKGMRRQHSSLRE